MTVNRKPYTEKVLKQLEPTLLTCLQDIYGIPINDNKIEHAKLMRYGTDPVDSQVSYLDPSEKSSKGVFLIEHRRHIDDVFNFKNIDPEINQYMKNLTSLLNGLELKTQLQIKTSLRLKSLFKNKNNENKPTKIMGLGIELSFLSNDIKSKKSWEFNHFLYIRSMDQFIEKKEQKNVKRFYVSNKESTLTHLNYFTSRLKEYYEILKDIEIDISLDEDDFKTRILVLNMLTI